MEVDKLTLTPLESNQNVTTIRKFRKILQTSMGPNGSSKILITGGGYFQLTCVGAQLLERLDLENPICRYIGRVAAGLPDLGLYFGVMVTHLLEQQWAHNRIPKYKFSQIIQNLIQTFQKLLTSPLVCRKVNFCTIDSFLPLVKTILKSKCNSLCDGMDINKFCFEIVKVFINCIDEQTNMVGEIYIKVKSGLNSISSHNGLLYEIVSNNNFTNIDKISDEVKVLVFTIKLENQCGEDSAIVNNEVFPIIEQAIKSGLKIVACQKTVGDDVKLYLMRRNIVLLDRMGSDFTTMLLHMSQAFPISQCCMKLSNIDKLLGSLSSVQYIHFNESDYIILQNKNVSVGTLLIQNSSLAGTDYIKTLVQKSISSLRSLTANPLLLLGGGCFEVWLIAQIHILKACQTDKDYLTILHWVQKSLASTCSAPPVVLDSVYHHGWTEDSTKCKCGLVTRNMVEQKEGRSILLCEVVNTQTELVLNPPIQPSTVIHNDVLVDCYLHKNNTILSALETFANLNEIGFILHQD